MTALIPETTYQNILHRAHRLREDGYSAREIVDGVIEVTGGTETYSIVDGKCNCKFARLHDGFCKHSAGLALLLETPRMTLKDCDEITEAEERIEYWSMMASKYPREANLRRASEYAGEFRALCAKWGLVAA